MRHAELAGYRYRRPALCVSLHHHRPKVCRIVNSKPFTKAAMSFTGGKLKLKGGASLTGGVDKKKKKKKSDALAVVASEEPPSEQARAAHAGPQGDSHQLEGQAVQQPAEQSDRRTAAERRYDDTQAKRAADKTRKMATKSHRERVAEFNAHLASLSEHHDIPKVGPG